MAPRSATKNLEELLSGPVDHDNVDTIAELVYDSYAGVDLAYDRIRQMEEGLEKLEDDARRDMAEKIGILQFMMGEYDKAVESLSEVKTRKTAAHFLGRSLLKQRRSREAIEWLEKGRSGDEDLETDLLLIEAYCNLRDPDEAEKLLKKHKGGDSADYDYVCGRVADLQGSYGEAIECYEAALEKDPEHAAALFHLALNHDLNGDDERAKELYRRCSELKPTYVGALMNLGILYEDGGSYSEAIDCYKRVLAIDPRHKQAQLYLKDAESSLNMFIDLSRIRHMQRMQEVFNLPVSNFELSARSRSTLDRMDIKTLGGLTKLTRDDLLNEKNFGDTSLGEIEDLLDRYELELGGPAGTPEPLNLVDDEEEEEADGVMATPVGELNFSTRCRKCMDRLNITTVGELIQYAEDELLDTPNFGVTSLQEVKDKLAELGLELKSE